MVRTIKIWRLALTVVLVSLAVLVPVVGLQVSCLLTQASGSLAGLDGQADVILQAAGQTVGEAHRTAVAARMAAEASAGQTTLLVAQTNRRMVQIRALLNDLTKLTGNANAFLINTDDALNSQGGALHAATETMQKAGEGTAKLAAAADGARGVLASVEGQTLPQVNAVLVNLKDGTKSGAEAAESVNQGLAPLRKRAGRFVTALKIIGHFVRATVRIF